MSVNFLAYFFSMLHLGKIWYRSISKTIARSLKCTLALTTLSAGAVTAQELPTLTENMPYAEARERLKEAGWQASYNYYSPARFERLNLSEKYIVGELQFAELNACLETSPELCVFQFSTADGKLLTITTENNSGGNQPSIVNWELEEKAIDLSQSLPLLHQDKPYAEIRTALIDAGWQPIPQFYSSQADRDLSQRLGYEELVTCSGTGLGLCLFKFSAANGQTLQVTTAWGQELSLYSWWVEAGRQ